MEVHMTEVGFHTVILVAMGIVGLAWLAVAVRAEERWPTGKRIFIGSCMFFNFLLQALSAFPSVAAATSAELFGFIGCTLGCLGAVFQATGVKLIPVRPAAVDA
jgi:hypothetical protein